MATQQLVQVQKGKRPAFEVDDSFAVPTTRLGQEKEAIRLAANIKDGRYNLGRVLAALLRTPETGYLGGKYTNFAAFCRGELNISAAHCRKLAQVAENFTRQQFNQFGSSKLSMILHGVKNPGDRRRAMTMLAEGKTMVEIGKVFFPEWKRTYAQWTANRKLGQSLPPAGFTAIKTAAMKLTSKEKLTLAQELFDSVKKAN